MTDTQGQFMQHLIKLNEATDKLFKIQELEKKREINRAVHNNNSNIINFIKEDNTLNIELKDLKMAIVLNGINLKLDLELREINNQIKVITNN